MHIGFVVIYQGGDFSVTDRLDLQAVVDNNLNEPFPIMKEISNWRRFYAVINAASIFIEKAPGTLRKINPIQKKI